MPAPLQLEHRLVALEVVAIHQACLLKLGQHPVDGGQANLLAAFQQLAIDGLGTQMPVIGIFQQFQDLHPGQGHLQSGLFQILAFQGVLRSGPESMYNPATLTGAPDTTRVAQ